jgi:hypothetical protein
MSSDVWDSVIKAAAAAGPFGTLLTLSILYIINKERVSANRQLLEITEQGLKAMNKVAVALDAINKKVGAKRRRSARSRR